MKYYWIQKDDNNKFNYLADYADTSYEQNGSALTLLFKDASSLLEAKNNAMQLTDNNIEELDQYLQSVGFNNFNLYAYLRN